MILLVAIIIALGCLLVKVLQGDREPLTIAATISLVVGALVYYVLR